MVGPGLGDGKKVGKGDGDRFDLNIGCQAKEEVELAMENDLSKSMNWLVNLIRFIKASR